MLCRQLTSPDRGRRDASATHRAEETAQPANGADVASLRSSSARWTKPPVGGSGRRVQNRHRMAGEDARHGRVALSAVPAVAQRGGTSGTSHGPTACPFPFAADSRSLREMAARRHRCPSDPRPMPAGRGAMDNAAHFAGPRLGWTSPVGTSKPRDDVPGGAARRPAEKRRTTWLHCPWIWVACATDVGMFVERSKPWD
jgi:hypothetical protein